MGSETIRMIKKIFMAEYLSEVTKMFMDDFSKVYKHFWNLCARLFNSFHCAMGLFFDLNFNSPGSNDFEIYTFIAMPDT